MVYDLLYATFAVHMIFKIPFLARTSLALFTSASSALYRSLPLLERPYSFISLPIQTPHMHAISVLQTVGHCTLSVLFACTQAHPRQALPHGTAALCSAMSLDRAPCFFSSIFPRKNLNDAPSLHDPRHARVLSSPSQYHRPSTPRRGPLPNQVRATCD